MRSQTRARAATHCVEKQKALQPRAVIGQSADAIEAQIHDFLPDRVMPARVVVRRVLLSADELLGVEQLSVRARAHLVNHRWLQIEEYAARHVLTRARLTEESVEGVITAADGFIRGHLPVGLNAVLEAVQFPARIADLNTCLADVQRDDLAHC